MRMFNEIWLDRLRELLESPNGAELFAYQIHPDGSKHLIVRGAMARDVRIEVEKDGKITTWLRPLMNPTSVKNNIQYFDISYYRARGHNSSDVQVTDSGTVLFTHPDGDEVVEICKASVNASFVNSEWDDWLATQEPDDQESIRSLVA